MLGLRGMLVAAEVHLQACHGDQQGDVLEMRTVLAVDAGEDGLEGASGLLHQAQEALDAVPGVDGGATLLACGFGHGVSPSAGGWRLAG